MRFLAIPASLTAAALFFWLFLQAESLMLGVLAATLVAGPVLWIAVSALWPPEPDRRCPKCAQDALVPLKPGDEVGVRCAACGHKDEAASTALLDTDGEESGVRSQESGKQHPDASPSR